MRRNRLTVTILAASLVVLVTIATLLAAGLATYLILRDGQRHGIDGDFRNTIYQSLAAAAVIGLLVSAAICALIWQVLLRPLRQIGRYAASVRTEPHNEPLPTAPATCSW